MATKKLAANVYVNGDFHAAGTSPDKDVADQITNPRAWDAEEPEDVVVDGSVTLDSGEKPKRTARKSS